MQKAEDMKEYAKFKALKIKIRKLKKDLPNGWELYSNFISDIGLMKTELDIIVVPEDTKDSTGYYWKKGLPKGNKQYPEYSNWKNMRARCSAPCLAEVRDYQTKGIIVCKEWGDFQTFYEDMGPKPSPKHSIDRIDNSKGYNPNNCRWADDTVQARNQGKVKTFTVKGITGCIPEIAEHFNLNSNSIHKHMQKGKSITEAVESLLKDTTISYKGYTLTKAQWADKLGVSRPTLYARFSKYESLDKVFEKYDIV